MATFVGVHSLADPSDENVKTSWEKYKTAANELGIKPLQVGYNLDKRQAMCLTEAESADQVRQAHEKAGATLDDVFEVKILT